MAQYNKSFNFKNGLQVDNDNFIINASGLVGIGSTIPSAHLDVVGSIVNTGEITEFVNEEIEKLQEKVAEKLGYKLVDHRLELYGSKIKK